MKHCHVIIFLHLPKWNPNPNFPPLLPSPWQPSTTIHDHSQTSPLDTAHHHHHIFSSLQQPEAARPPSFSNIEAANICPCTCSLHAHIAAPVDLAAATTANHAAPITPCLTSHHCSTVGHHERTFTEVAPSRHHNNIFITIHVAPSSTMQQSHLHHHASVTWRNNSGKQLQICNQNEPEHGYQICYQIWCRCRGTRLEFLSF